MAHERKDIIQIEKVAVINDPVVFPVTNDSSPVILGDDRETVLKRNYYCLYIYACIDLGVEFIRAPSVRYYSMVLFSKKATQFLNSLKQYP